MADVRSKKESTGASIRGIGVSPGVVIGPVFLISSESNVTIPERELSLDDLDREIGRFERALIATRQQLKSIQVDMEARGAGSDTGILDAHLLVLDDRMFVEEVVTEVRTRRTNVEPVVRRVAERYSDMLASLGDEYLRERVVDVRDVSRRLIRNLTGNLDSSIARLTQKHVIVSNDLAPSETASLRKDMVLGFITDQGSPTSHTAVMARSLEIPAVVALRDITQKVTTGDEVLVDGNKGIVVVNPTSTQLEEYGKVTEVRRGIQRDLSALRTQPAKTKDGHRITLSANIETPDEVDYVLESGAEGVGLFRSEYLYLSRDRIVGEDEQAEAYAHVAHGLAPSPVIIRTLDLGGDKYLPSHERFHEANPFLGCRSIRLSLMYPEQLRAQLRAILKASDRGNVKIMYPMISSVTEVIQANEILEEAKNDLVAKGVPFDKQIEVGAMIEIPAAALTADAIAEHVKFFSIGTNDLIQYTIAVDRVNDRVAYLYEPTHPAVLRLVRETVEAGHRHGIWVGVCGEMAGDPLLSPLLIGMGVDELSMAPVAVPLVKDAIRKLTRLQAGELVQNALGCTTATEVLSHCRKLMKEIAPELLELI